MTIDTLILLRDSDTNTNENTNAQNAKMKIQKFMHMYKQKYKYTQHVSLNSLQNHWHQPGDVHLRRQNNTDTITDINANTNMKLNTRTIQI